jgi:nicotinamidase-related amidase
MKKLLIVVDMQVDFVDGALGTPEAQAIVAPVVEKIKAHQGPVVFTRDTHGEDYLQTQEGRNLPVRHCIKDTEGWQLTPAVEALVGDCRVFDKITFGSVELAHYVSRLFQAGEIGGVELIGLCTDICVVSNTLLLKAHYPEAPISVDAACCAGVTPATHQAALTTMGMCQIEVKS